jgi:hypothetical protein
MNKDIIHLLPLHEGNMKICLPEANHIYPEGNARGINMIG